jgi:hypothetical protein
MQKIERYSRQGFRSFFFSLICEDQPAKELQQRELFPVAAMKSKTFKKYIDFILKLVYFS